MSRSARLTQVKQPECKQLPCHNEVCQQTLLHQVRILHHTHHMLAGVICCIIVRNGFDSAMSHTQTQKLCSSCCEHTNDLEYVLGAHEQFAANTYLNSHHFRCLFASEKQMVECPACGLKTVCPHASSVKYDMSQINRGCVLALVGMSILW